MTDSMKKGSSSIDLQNLSLLTTELFGHLKTLGELTEKWSAQAKEEKLRTEQYQNVLKATQDATKHVSPINVSENENPDVDDFNDVETDKSALAGVGDSEEMMLAIPDDGSFFD